MSQWRALVFAAGIGAVLTACDIGGASVATPAPATTNETTTPATTSPGTRPALVPAGSIGGPVVRLVPNGVVIDSAGRELEVTFVNGVDVWKETKVPATALELGDRLFIEGTGGSPFVATKVWANIGVIDGVVRALDATGMDLEVGRTAQVERVEFSQYLEIIGGNAALPHGGLSVGQEITLLVYQPPGGRPRATRIFL